jgi:hypothetical protein
LDDFGRLRLTEMVLAAQDFGLEQVEAYAVAWTALDQSGDQTELLDAVADALAERVLENLRRDLHASRG